MVEERRCQEVLRGDLGISCETGVGRHQARRIDGTPASRVHSEHHRETAGNNAELPHRQGRASVRHSRAVSIPPVRSVHPMDPIGSVGRGWLMGPLSSGCRGQVAGDKHADESPSRRRGPRGPVSISVSPIGATRGGLAWSTSNSSYVQRDNQRVGFVVDRLPKVHASDDLDGDDRGDHPVDDHAEGWPPPRVRNEVGSVLPEVFQAVTDEADDEEP